jgi:hypothetical protein
MAFSLEEWFIEMQQALDAVAWAVWTTINPNIKYLLSHLAFMHDMIFHKAVAIDRESIQQEHQHQTKMSNNKENSSRIKKTYYPGDYVLIVKDSSDRRNQSKMDKPMQGPYKITRVILNGTVEIDRNTTTEIINIRHLKPFYNNG